MNEQNTDLIPIDNLIVVEQLPVITEQLRSVQAYIKKKTESVLALDCNEGTVKAIKALRSDLNKSFTVLEERRKLVKSKVLAPYEAFEKIYKECVSDIFKSTGKELKKRIDEVEDSLKDDKRKEVEDWFNEYAKSKGVDFVGFFDSGINVTLSASKKSLQEKAKSFIDRICDDLALIETQEHKAEIFVEYKNNLNVSTAIRTVKTRYEDIAREEERAAQKAKERQERHDAAVKAMEAAMTAKEPLSAPKTDEDIPKGELLSAPKEDRVYEMTFTVKAKKSKLVALKKFILSDSGYEIITRR